MDISKNALQMLELMARPGFIAVQGKILHVNTLALAYQLTPELQLSELLQEGYAQYQSFSQGSLALTVQLGDQTYPVTVERLDGFDLFLLEPKETCQQLRALAMASQQLRIPLSGLMNALDSDAPSQARHAARQLHRAVSNMSDAMGYRSLRKPALCITELRSFLAGVVEAAQAHAETAGVQLSYRGLNNDLYCLIDQELLERAILNLISNAMKAHSTQLQICAARKGKTIHLQFTDNGDGVPSQLRAQMFSRYLRQPGLFDNSYGLGLGMVIIHSAATAHNGTVLMEHLQPHGLQVTMTLEITEGECIVQLPPFRFDYLGGMDHTITELSDVLPDSQY